MNAARLRAWVSTTEILTGIGAAGTRSYLLWDLSNCNPNAALCRPLGMLPVLLLLVPGCLTATSGLVSYSTTGFPFWAVQITLVVLVALYFASFYAVVLVGRYRDVAGVPSHALLVTLMALMFSAAPSHSQSRGDSMTQTARGTFVVSLKPLAFEGADPEFKLGRMSIDKQITGELTASTVGQMLSAMTGTDGSAGYVALERVEGVLHGKRGTFVLQHSGTMSRGAPSLVVTVVPDSGTGELVGLEGEFEIDIEDGIHSYEFTYRLPTP